MKNETYKKVIGDKRFSPIPTGDIKYIVELESKLNTAIYALKAIKEHLQKGLGSGYALGVSRNALDKIFSKDK